MFSELILKLGYFAGVLFNEEDRAIFMIVLSTVVMLPVLLCILRWKPLVRGTALIVFAVYILGNLSFTILNRSPGYFGEAPAFFNYRQAFDLDFSLWDTLRLLPEGLGETLSHIHISSYTYAREVFLNILLYRQNSIRSLDRVLCYWVVRMEGDYLTACEVFGVVKLPVADARFAAVAREDIGHDPLGVFIVQFWQQRHALPPLRNESPCPSAGAYGCGYTSWPSPGKRC